jgi:hypothetical protein
MPLLQFSATHCAGVDFLRHGLAGLSDCGRVVYLRLQKSQVRTILRRGVALAIWASKTICVSSISNPCLAIGLRFSLCQRAEHASPGQNRLGQVANLSYHQPSTRLQGKPVFLYIIALRGRFARVFLGHLGEFCRGMGETPANLSGRRWCYMPWR